MRNIAIKRLTGFLAVLLFPLASWGQNADFITLYGHVSDNATSEPLYYSSVNLRGTNINNVSNLDGYFSLKIPQTTSPDTQVLISHLGYTTGVVNVSSFYGYTSSKPLEIKLMQTSIVLEPVTVRSSDAYELVRSAFSRIRDNYPMSRVGMTAFYREMIRKGTSKYLVMNEAVVDIDKASYLSYNADKVGIYKGRGSTDYDSSDTIFVKLQGGLYTALEIDQVKNPLAGLELEEAMQSYRFFMDGMATYDGHNFYRVGFKPNENIEDILFRGTIFIEEESLAIGRVELEMDVEGREEKAAQNFIVKAPSNIRFSVNMAKYVVSYKCFEGKWYYDYCRADISFTTKKRRSLFRKSFTVTEEMAITDHKEGGIAIEPASRVRFKDILTDQVADFTDENFWEDYNIIEPDQSIETIVKKIVRKLGRRR